MLRRKAYDKLLEWKSRKNHKCLVVGGQRQVGKTYIIDHFGKENYDRCIRIDLSEADARWASIFDGPLNVDEMISNITVRCRTDSINPEGTLIFLDEVQECPRAFKALKEFTIDGRYDVIASGSMLGVQQFNLGDEGLRSIVPSGYIESMTMYSLDFEEFLWARGISENVIASVRTQIREREPIDPYVFDAFSAMFRDFMNIGGMPEAVSAAISNKSALPPAQIMDAIVSNQRLDISRYSRGIESLKIRACYDSIPSQLGGSNKKFMYSDVEKGERNASARKYRDCLTWIGEAGYGNFCFALREIRAPLRGSRVEDQFKVYMSDTGLLTHFYGYDAAIAMLDRDLSHNMGAVVENEVAECLMKAGYPRYYYRKSNGRNMMEIDFVLELGSELVAVEVKSGTHRSSPSLSKVSSVFDVSRRIMLEDSNIRIGEDGVEHYPIFAAAFIDEMDPGSSGRQLERYPSLERIRR